MCVLDMRREFQVVVSNFELFCLSVRREIVVSTFYVFLSLSISLRMWQDWSYDHIHITKWSWIVRHSNTNFNKSSGIRSGGERTRNSIGYRYRDGGVGTYSSFVLNHHVLTHTLTFTYRCMMSKCYWKRLVMWKCLLLFRIPERMRLSLEFRRALCWKGM